MSGIEILLSDRHGTFIPKLFSEQFGGWGVLNEDIVDLSDPENETYWDTWDAVMQYAKHTDSKGNVWTLYQNGDLFAICEDLMTEDERKDFYGE